jgi:hypothetical protein
MYTCANNKNEALVHAASYSELVCCEANVVQSDQTESSLLARGFGTRIFENDMNVWVLYIEIPTLHLRMDRLCCFLESLPCTHKYRGLNLL